MIRTVRDTTGCRVGRAPRPRSPPPARVAACSAPSPRARPCRPVEGGARRLVFCGSRQNGGGGGLVRFAAGLRAGTRGGAAVRVRARVGARALVVAPTRPKRGGSLARLSTAVRGGPHSADGTAAPLNVARRTLLVHMRAGARLRPARVQAHDAHVPCGYAGGKPRINFGGGGVGFGSGGPRRAGF